MKPSAADKAFALFKTLVTSELRDKDSAQLFDAFVNHLIAGQAETNPVTALVDDATIDLYGPRHTLSSSSAARTFTISYQGDDIILEVTLAATSATYTFPIGSLCSSEGTASGDNTLALAGVSGDKYIISVKKLDTTYYVVAKNFGQ